MNAQERDELLIRLDERTNNIWNLTEKQEEHLTELNDTITQHAVKIASNGTSIKWIIRIFKILGASGLISGTGAGIWSLLNGG